MSDSDLFLSKSNKAAYKKTPEVSDSKTKLLALAELVAHFGSWQLDISQPKAMWSPGMYRVFGLEPRTEGVTWEEYSSFIHPEDLESANKNAQTMLNSPLNHRESFDYRIIHRDGSVHIIRSQRQVVEVDAKGKAIVVVGVDQDVTEQKQAEEALRRSEERFRAVAEAANVLVYEYDLIKNKVHIIRGEKELVGLEPKEVEDRTIDWVINRLHPDDVQHVLAVWDKAINDPTVDRYSMEYRFRHENGGYIIVADTTKAVKDSSGKTVLFIGGIRDITRRKRDQEKIQQYSKHLEELVEQRTRELQEKERLAAIGATAGMVGHDIRNPLQALVSEVYLIKTELANLPQSGTKKCINESLDSIEQGIMYINKIIADLQDYSRPLTPELQKTNLASLVEDVIQTIQFTDNIKLTVNIKAIPEIILEYTFTKRALTNLINNAIQAMPNGGQLKIDAYQENDNISIVVADTGVGIPDEVKAKIFSPMFTTKAKGQGLGLAVVKRLIEAQGGSISFESKVGVGTTFRIKLPIYRD
ncbi:MAG: PAS domain-containing protein [Candidatus Bathyarchaeia archaeon]